MKTAIKLVLIYFVCQILGVFLAMIPAVLIVLLKHGDMAEINSLSLAPSMLIGFLLMFSYLYKTGYISKSKKTWSFVSLDYLLYSSIMALSAIFLIDYLMSFMSWLPDWMEDSFDALQAGSLGIICIALLGPILEELLFRGAVTKILLQKYTPTKAIFLSALIFGIFHLNPAQIVGAGLMGVILAWIYYKTASLIPCILMHVINNSLSVYLNIKYPDANYTEDILGSNYYIWLLLAGVLFLSTFLLMNKRIFASEWKENIMGNNDMN
ncbi:type II CAAX endopeptidase family protein [uncultured Bacteroides sp.]|uniref:CPBP family intramembrane glutamic endopeptidase n=1 Tax=uncultured Bacteroides sp. TaxID=162156 RepID=UPI002AAA872B|nr:type II CAAX endopeptidase family protein [uncultured Bacteroides sp.]